MEKLPCDTHAEQIKTLFKQDEVLEEKVKEADSLNRVIHNLDKNMALQTQLLENVVAHNDRQDKRMDEQQQVIININENLTELTEGQRVLNKRVGKLEDQVEKSKNKGKVDIVDTFAKYIPYLVLVGTGYLILNITKFIK